MCYLLHRLASIVLLAVSSIVAPLGMMTSSPDTRGARGAWSAIERARQADSSDARAKASRLVGQILRADYEGDRAALRRLHAEMPTDSDVGRTAARLRYWRGFALWRRAINGVNDGAPRPELEEDLSGAVREFDAALARDPGFVDATAGVIGSGGFLAFLAAGDPERLSPLVARFLPMIAESRAAAPDHPRLLWVLGPNEWRPRPGETPAQIAERQARAIAMYTRALAIVRKDAASGAPIDDLEPRWGEPELLMNLAWSNLNRATPDLAAADRYANEALALVPYWHYVRDILLPQIRRAKEQPQAQGP